MYLERERKKKMKSVNVVAAVICDKYEEKTKIFATQRGYGEYKDGWEFPGGKIEEGESPEQALVREIKEELDAKIEVHDLIDVIDYGCASSDTYAKVTKELTGIYGDILGIAPDHIYICYFGTEDWGWNGSNF